MTHIHAKTLTAAHKALVGDSFLTLAKAQEAAHTAILKAIPGDMERVTITGDEQGSNVTVKIVIDPTTDEDDAFGIVYIGTRGPDAWTFAFKEALDITDKRG